MQIEKKLYREKYTNKFNEKKVDSSGLDRLLRMVFGSVKRKGCRWGSEEWRVKSINSDVFIIENLTHYPKILKWKAVLVGDHLLFRKI